MQGQLYVEIKPSCTCGDQVDCSKALAMEGVLAVMTGDDLVKPGNEMLGSGRALWR